MKNYRRVLQFYYKGNSYNMYLDNHNKHYFLKNDENNNLSYITINELIDLTLFFVDIPFIMHIKRDSKKYLPKVIIGGISITLSSTLLNTVIEMYKSQDRVNYFEKNRMNSSQTVEEDIKNYISYDDQTVENKENQDELVVDTFLESKWLHYLYIYDMEYLDKALNYKNVNIAQIKALIEDNQNISLKMKNLLYEYCDALINKYPNIELRTFYENLKTLQVIECDKEELVTHSLSVDSYGCYVRNENKIYVLKDYDYIKGTWPYQVIFHEFSHCLRTGAWNINGTKIRVQVEGQNFNNTITAEALNSLFTVSLFDYNEQDIAYQLQSNYHSVMLECMDNYKIEDYVSHSLSYYANKLDEFNQDDNYATVILELIQAQYKDYHNDLIVVPQEQYYPIYDYVANMYYQKNLNSSMSYLDAVNVTDQLINKIMFDVPEDYNIDIDHFYEHLNAYCNTIGIKTNEKMRS